MSARHPGPQLHREAAAAPMVKEERTAKDAPASASEEHAAPTERGRERCERLHTSTCQSRHHGVTLEWQQRAMHACMLNVNTKVLHELVACVAAGLIAVVRPLHLSRKKSAAQGGQIVQLQGTMTQLQRKKLRSVARVRHVFRRRRCAQKRLTLGT